MLDKRTLSTVQHGRQTSSADLGSQTSGTEHCGRWAGARSSAVGYRVCAEAWRYEGVVAGRAERKIVEKHGSAQRGQRAGRTRRTCGERAGERAGDVGLQPAKGPESDAGASLQWPPSGKVRYPGHGTASCRVASVASRAPSPRPDSGPRHTRTPVSQLTAPRLVFFSPSLHPTRTCTRTPHTFSLQYISHTPPDTSMYS